MEGTMVSVNGGAIPRNKDYSTLYTPLFRIKLNNDPLRYNGFKGVVKFSVYRISGGELKPKDFICYIGVASDGDTTTKIQFFELSEWIASPYVVIDVDDAEEYGTVYARGGNSSDFIGYQINYAPYESYIEKLFDEDILISSLVDPISPTSFKDLDVTAGANWNITSAAQRVFKTSFNMVDIDYYTYSNVAGSVVAGSVIGNVSIHPQTTLTIPCVYYDTLPNPTTSGICTVQIDSGSGDITVVEGISTGNRVHIKLNYQFTI